VFVLSITRLRDLRVHKLRVAGLHVAVPCLRVAVTALPSARHTTATTHWYTAGCAPATPSTMDSSSLGARRRLGHDATNTTLQRC